MPRSQATVPIIVAVIGVVGIIIPPFVIKSLDYHYPDINIEGFTNGTYSSVNVINEGNAPATNLTIILSTLKNGVNIVGITNAYSATELTVPNNTILKTVPSNNTHLEPSNITVLEPGVPNITNLNTLKIHTSKLVHGSGSGIYLDITTSGSDPPLTIKALYDQGSQVLLIPKGGNGSSLPSETIRNPSNDPLTPIYAIIYYVILAAGVIGLIYYYHFRPRKSLKGHLRDIMDDILKIRRKLLEDRNTPQKFSFKVWSDIPLPKRLDNHHVNEFVLIDDFYADLEKRNSYLSRVRNTGESNLSRANTLSRLNEALLASAENALNKVDWNKYR